MVLMNTENKRKVPCCGYKATAHHRHTQPLKNQGFGGFYVSSGHVVGKNKKRQDRSPAVYLSSVFFYDRIEAHAVELRHLPLGIAPDRICPALDPVVSFLQVRDEAVRPGRTDLSQLLLCVLSITIGADLYPVDLMRSRGLIRPGRLLGTAQRLRHLQGEVFHPCHEPVARARLVGEPPVNRQDHLVLRRLVIQRLLFAAQPEQPGLAVPAADVHAQVDQPLVYRIVERIRMELIAGALDRDGPLVVRRGAGAPAAAVFRHAQHHAPVGSDAVVAGGLRGGVVEAGADRLDGQLPDHAVRCDPVDRHRPLPGITWR